MVSNQVISLIAKASYLAPREGRHLIPECEIASVHSVRQTFERHCAQCNYSK